MAAKSKKRQFKIENKLLKLDKLTLEDVICSICQSILIEPVTLPCFHDFCKFCFNGSIENNALCCPLCRLRIGSWLRTATKQNNLVNKKLWEFIKSKFQKEIDTKSRGEDIKVPNGDTAPRLLSEPGEIRLEYETELNRLRTERLHLEQQHLHKTEILVQQLQNEEEESNRSYIERLKEDELLAREIQENRTQDTQTTIVKFNNNVSKLKKSKIDSFFIKKAAGSFKDSPQLTDDNTSTDSTTPLSVVLQRSTNASVGRKISTEQKKSQIDLKPPSEHNTSPEIVPTYGSYLKTLLNSKIRNVSEFWSKKKEEIPKKVLQKKPENLRPKRCLQSLPVSLPYKGLLQRNQSLLAARRDSDAADSVDSIQQEFCYFKPIDEIDSVTPTGLKDPVNYPLKIPPIRVVRKTSLQNNPEPSRDDYLDRLCELRKHSLDQNLPSAFVISLKSLQVTQNYTTKLEGSLKLKIIKTTTCQNPTANGLLHPPKRSGHKKHSVSTDHVKTKKKSLRRTRSTGSIPKNINETTPKKAKIKERKVVSERKPFLRSDSLRAAAQSPTVPESVMNNINVKSVVKQLASPLKNCDVKVIVEEQFRIEKMLDQEKRDLEMARRMEAEWNSRPPRRATTKRQATLNLIRPHKRLRA